MLFQQVLKFYGGKKVNIASAVGVTPGYVSQWGEVIPESMATKLALITKGALKYDPDLYSKTDAKKV